MAQEKLLAVYLNDHLAGSTAGRDLARKLVKDTAGSSREPVMAELLTEIEADRGVLEDVMKRLGIEQQPIKQAGSWLVEKVGRLRLSEPLTRSAALSLLMEMETLSVGVAGKRAVWEALGASLGTDPRLAEIDFAVLVDRAQQQLDTLAQQRRTAAVDALSG